MLRAQSDLAGNDTAGMMRVRSAHELGRQEGKVERLAIGIEDELLGSSEDSCSFETPQNSGALRRPYAFPKLNQVQRLYDRREGSQRPKVSSDVPASNLAQEANEPCTSPDAGEAPDTKSGATPLPPKPFDGPLTAGVAIRMDAFRLVHLADVSTGHRLRGVVDEFIPAMVGSMSTHDVIQPPVVRPDPSNPGKFLLVAGLQRLNAARASGADEILCRVVELTDVEAELWEIDENLVRTPLSPAQEALFIDRRRELHEQLHGKAKARGAIAANVVMGRAHASANLADASSFVDVTAKRIGKSARSVQRVVQRATQNGRDDLTRVVGTSLDRGNELDTLPLLPPNVRGDLIEQAAAGAEVSAVQTRRERLDQSVVAEDRDAAADLQQSRSDSTEAENDVSGLSALQSAWLGASSSARETFLTWIKTADQP
jgi:ParB/RepB/Spo0J family partition protein